MTQRQWNMFVATVLVLGAATVAIVGMDPQPKPAPRLPDHASALTQANEVARHIEQLPRYFVTNDIDSRA